MDEPNSNRTKPRTFTLYEDESAALDALAAHLGTSRSRALAAAVKAMLEKIRKEKSGTKQQP